MTRTSPFDNSLNDPGSFTVTYELVPGQGAGGKKVDRLLEFASRVKQDGRITALSVTDNAGGHPALAPVAIGSEIRKIGLEPMIHFSLKDKNRNQVESHFFLYQRQHIRYLLVLGGDFPKPTYYGQAKPVYDLDTIQTIELVEHIKAGRYRYRTGNDKYQPLSLQCGCVVSPFKMTEPEQVWQYAKLLKKIRAGARFIITQLGFDLTKYNELIRFLRQENISVPTLANVFIPSPAVAALMAAGGVPGVLLTPKLAARMATETKKERLLRAARMTAVLRGMGYDGVHLGGNGLDFDDIGFVLDKAEELRDSWQEVWERVNSPIDQIWSLYDNRDSARQQPLHPGIKPGYRFAHQLAHDLFFVRTSPFARIFSRFSIFCDRYRISRTLFTLAERIIKEILFNCRMCGDCTISESAYLCPQSGCPKTLINGPCGGSRNMQCEVFPDRLCFYVRVYLRLDRKSSIHSLGAQPILPPKDWALQNSSSWINYFQGRDHTGGRIDNK